MSVPVSPLQAGEIIRQQHQVDVRRVVQDALERAHYAGRFLSNWEGSQKASDRIVRELGLESKDGD